MFIIIFPVKIAFWAVPIFIRPHPGHPSTGLTGDMTQALCSYESQMQIQRSECTRSHHRSLYTFGPWKKNPHLANFHSDTIGRWQGKEPHKSPNTFFPERVAVEESSCPCSQNNPGPRSQEQMLDISGLFFDPVSARAQPRLCQHSMGIFGPCAWVNFQRFGCPKRADIQGSTGSPLFAHGVDTQYLHHTIRLTVAMVLRLTSAFKIHIVQVDRNYFTTRPVIVTQSCLSAKQKNDMLANKHLNLGGPQCYFRK